MNFGGIPAYLSAYESSRIVILPVPFDETSTWIKGADRGPDAILEASANMELYDIETDSEVYKRGIYTADALKLDRSPGKMVKQVEKAVEESRQRRDAEGDGDAVEYGVAPGGEGDGGWQSRSRHHSTGVNTPRQAAGSRERVVFCEFLRGTRSAGILYPALLRSVAKQCRIVYFALDLRNRALLVIDIGHGNCYNLFRYGVSVK